VGWGRERGREGEVERERAKGITKKERQEKKFFAPFPLL
jgi:hypothetical protein